MEAERELQTKVLARFEAATEEGDASAIAKYCTLLGPLGLASEGIKGYLGRHIESIKNVHFI